MPKTRSFTVVGTIISVAVWWHKDKWPRILRVVPMLKGQSDLSEPRLSPTSKYASWVPEGPIFGGAKIITTADDVEVRCV